MADYLHLILNFNATEKSKILRDKNSELLILDDNVYTVATNGTKHDWVIKFYRTRPEADRERILLTQLHAVENVPKILYFHREPMFVNIISRAPGMDLWHHLQKYGPLSFDEARIIASSLLRTLKDVHQRGVIHRDIKPENIIYDRVLHTVTLVDFSVEYTMFYCSPEQILQDRITAKTDLWSLGVTLYTLCSGEAPFSSRTEVLIGLPHYPIHWSDSLVDFLACLIEVDVDSRYSIDEALEHAWLYEGENGKDI